MDLEDVPNALSGSSLYPMLIASLVMQNYTPQTKTTFQQEYDYIVVGAGTAGSVVAGRLSEDPSVSVLLLEAGPSPPPSTEIPSLCGSFAGSYIDWNIKTTPQKYLDNRAIIFPRGKTVGGTGIINGMVNIRGNPQDFDDWASSGCTGWSYNDVLYYFKKMEDFRVPELFDDYYNGLYGPTTMEKSFAEAPTTRFIFQAAVEMGLKFLDVNGATQYGVTPLITTTRDGKRCSTAKAYLVPANQRPNLDIIANAHVYRVIVENFRATGVQFEYDGDVYVVHAKKEVILSAGAINTPQILMLSGIGPREQLKKLQIPMVADLPVGQNFQDHLIIPNLYDISYKVPSFKSCIQDSCNIQKYINDGTGPLGGIHGVVGVAYPQSQIPSPPFNVPKNEVFLRNQILDEEGVITCEPSTVHVKSIGSVTLKSANPYDLPILDPNYYSDFDSEDLRNTIEGMRFCDQLMATDALKELEPKRRQVEGCEMYESSGDDYLICALGKTAYSGYHASGTVKMGNSSDPTTVVDPYLRVKGVSCLRVADASIMPYVTNGNTNSPTIMIGEKASDMIKSPNECNF